MLLQSCSLIKPWVITYNCVTITAKSRTLFLWLGDLENKAHFLCLFAFRSLRHICGRPESWSRNTPPSWRICDLRRNLVSTTPNQARPCMKIIKILATEGVLWLWRTLEGIAWTRFNRLSSILICLELCSPHLVLSITRTAFQSRKWTYSGGRTTLAFKRATC